MKSAAKSTFLLMLLVAGTGINVKSQAIWNVCVGEVYSTGSCQAGVPHSNSGVFTPANLTINAGDRIRFYTRMELLGGYNGTHDIRFTGSPANNVLLPISTNILARVTNVLTPPFSTAGTFPMECVDANHCFAFADLFSGWPCNTYGVTVNPVLSIQEPVLSLTQTNSLVQLNWKPFLTDAFIYFIERASDDFGFSPIDSATETNWQDALSSTSFYYRIGALNKQGDYAYSNVVRTQTNISPSPEVYPSLFKNEININAAFNLDDPLSVWLFNATGQIVISEKVFSPSSLDVIHLSTESIPAGVYFMKINGQETQWHYKLMKVD